MGNVTAISDLYGIKGYIKDDRWLGNREPVVTKVNHNMGHDRVRTLEFTVAIPGKFTKQGILQAVNQQLNSMPIYDEPKKETINKALENLINNNRIDNG